ncbi:hypothetical protein D3C86_1893370 [compost metagenome]
MVERPLGVDACRQAIALQQFDHLCRQLWVTGCRVLHLEQGLWKSAEVMPGVGLCVAADQQLIAFPMRGYNDDGPGFRQFGGQACQGGPAGTRFECQHGRAMGYVQAGEHE